ncbi:MAG: GTPase HflX [Candidatus Levybacteria bacterium]|nr:GTPase HflX [Candidatus Levybacteria bacterium]
MHINVPEKKQQRFLVASLISKDSSVDEAFFDIKETRDLIDTYGGTVVDYAIQRREVHARGSYLGRGKVEEITQSIKENDIDVVILNGIVKPGQIFEVKTDLSVENPNIIVWDRVDLILQIFSKHASTTEAKLQIELAAMRHMGPRIYDMGYVLSRQGGTVGTRGIGETNTELMKRHWRDQIKKTQDKINKLESEKKFQLERRQRNGAVNISIIGYTNAGKSSLFNLLTNKNRLVEDALFATLDSNIGKMYLPDAKMEVLLSDTIGFIKDLPPSLIDAFQSTLLESVYSDFLIHVIDASDPQIDVKIEAVTRVLEELKIVNKYQIYVFNKSDMLTPEEKLELQERFADKDPLFISVKNKVGIEEISKRLSFSLQQK